MTPRAQSRSFASDEVESCLEVCALLDTPVIVTNVATAAAPRWTGRILIKTLTGKTLALEATSNMFIADVKDKVEEQEGTAALHLLAVCTCVRG
jgi:hypothetical protein